jgi:hypothetical protein
MVFGQDAQPCAGGRGGQRVRDGSGDVAGLFQVRGGEFGVAEIRRMHHHAVRGLDLRLDLDLPLIWFGLRAGKDTVEQGPG